MRGKKFFKLLVNLIALPFLILGIQFAQAAPNNNISALHVSNKHVLSWQKAQNIFGAKVSAMAGIDSQTVFIGTRTAGTGNIYLTRDGGTHWVERSKGLPRKPIVALSAVNYKILYAAVKVNGNKSVIYRTTDAGKNWKVTGFNIKNSDILSLYTPTERTIYVGLARDGITKSTDAGEHWKFINGNISNYVLNVYAISGDGNGSLFISTSHYIFKTTDGGINWTNIYYGFTNRIIALNSKVVFAAGHFFDDTFIIKSDDGGKTWKKITPIFTSNKDGGITSIDVINAHTILTTTFANIYRTIDGGKSWTTLNKNILASRSDSKILYASNSAKTIYIGSQQGMLKSNDGGIHWNVINNDLYDLDVNSVAKAGNTLFAGTSSGMYESNDGGQIWAPKNKGLTDLDITSVASASNDIIYAGTGGDGIFKSIDGGAHWTAINNGLTNYAARDMVTSIYVENDQTIYATIWDKGVFKSTNGGAYWTLVKQDIATLVTGNPGTQVVFAVRYSNGAFFKSNNGGLNWEMIYINDNAIKSLKVVDSNTIYLGNWLGQVWKTVDGGKHWALMSQGLPGHGYIPGFIATNSDDVLVSIAGKGIYHTRDGGKDWVPLKDTQLGKSTVLSMALIDPNKLLVGTIGQGLYIER